MLATSERGAFVRKVHGLKEKELAKLLQKDGVPLRPDVKQVGNNPGWSGAPMGVSILLFSIDLN